jgi:hypothetical protein
MEVEKDSGTGLVFATEVAASLANTFWSGCGIFSPGNTGVVTGDPVV